MMSVGHVLDHVLDHMIIGLVTTALHGGKRSHKNPIQATCYNCNKKCHFAKKCPKLPKTKN